MEQQQQQEECFPQTFFNSAKDRFPPPVRGPKGESFVPTEAFLEAAKVLLTFIDSMGMAFAPVRKDIEGNIKKMEAKYLQDKEKYSTLDELLKEDGSDDIKKNCTIGAVWLERGLRFLQQMLINIVKNHCEEPREFKELMMEAYKVTLKPHHGPVMANLIFKPVSMMAPSKKTLFTKMKLSKDPEASDDQVVKEMDAYQQEMTESLQIFGQIIAEYKLKG